MGNGQPRSARGPLCLLAWVYGASVRAGRLAAATSSQLEGPLGGIGLPVGWVKMGWPGLVLFGDDGFDIAAADTANPIVNPDDIPLGSTAIWEAGSIPGLGIGTLRSGPVHIEQFFFTAAGSSHPAERPAEGKIDSRIGAPGADMGCAGPVVIKVLFPTLIFDRGAGENGVDSR